MSLSRARKLSRSDTYTRLKEIVTCAVCCELLKNPKVFPCLHSYCYDCIVELSKSECGLKCPECREQVEVRSFLIVHKYIFSYQVCNIQKIENIFRVSIELYKHKGKFWSNDK